MASKPESFNVTDVKGNTLKISIVETDDANVNLLIAKYKATVVDCNIDPGDAEYLCDALRRKAETAADVKVRINDTLEKAKAATLILLKDKKTIEPADVERAAKAVAVMFLESGEVSAQTIIDPMDLANAVKAKLDKADSTWREGLKQIVNQINQ